MRKEEYMKQHRKRREKERKKTSDWLYRIKPGVCDSETRRSVCLSVCLSDELKKRKKERKKGVE